MGTTVGNEGRQTAGDRTARLLGAVSRPAAQRIGRAAAWIAAAAVLLYAAWLSEIIGPKLFVGLPKLGNALLMMLIPSGFQHLPEFLWALMETIAMALLGTLIGAVFALPLAILCARTTFPIRILQFGFRRFS